MGYEHTQKGPWRFLGYFFALTLIPVVWAASDEPMAVVAIGGVMFLLVAVCEGFSRLTIRDEGDRLAVSFGPPPVWRTHIAYRDIESVEAARSNFLDGWGVHWIPGRGTIYNVWGYDCVRVTTPNRTVRLGTDDVERLVAFLTAKRYEYRTVAQNRAEGA